MYVLSKTISTYAYQIFIERDFYFWPTLFSRAGNQELFSQEKYQLKFCRATVVLYFTSATWLENKMIRYFSHVDSAMRTQTRLIYSLS